MSGLILGTRGSDLALAQTRQVAAALSHAHPDARIEIRIIRTTGDERLDADLKNPGPLGKGLFTRQLEEALLNRVVDVAIHSLKDLPVRLPEGLVLGAIPERADPRDVLVSRHPGGLAGLPAGARVGTSSARRERQLLALRPDITAAPIRGNVPTRVARLAEAHGGLDAILLAKAGLDRLGMDMPAGLHLTIEEKILPAPGQGALGLECRAGDMRVLDLLGALHHEPTARCVRAERQLLDWLGAGCAAPVGALAVPAGQGLVLRSVVFAEQGGAG